MAHGAEEAFPLRARQRYISAIGNSRPLNGGLPTRTGGKLMGSLTRRSVLQASVAAAAVGSVARPYIANAQAKTASVWWSQGFVPQEDDAFRKLVADYEKVSGNKIDHSITPFAPLRQKIISAITSGVVPDLMTVSPLEVAPLQAWDDKLVDVSDVVETQKSKMIEAALATATCYNNVKKERSFYSVPHGAGVNPFHIWRTLVEKAGYKMSDIPKTWDAFIDFFIPVEKKLRSMGMRHTHATGFVVSTIGNDPNATLAQFLLAYGAKDIVTPDGTFHGDDKQVLEGVTKSLEKLSKLYMEKHIPPSSINWNDADDNNAFHSKLCVMDFDGTLSTELAMLRKQKDEYNDVVTMQPQLDNDGKQMMSQMGTVGTMIPKGAKNIEVAKDFQKYLIQPEVNNEFLKGGLGRYMPTMVDVVKNDPWWNDAKRDSHVPPYIHQGLFSPTKPDYFAYNPAWAQVRSEHTFHIAFHEIVAEGKPLKEAVAKAMKRVEEIFAKYQIKA
jgi:multiple sugar transport system substrate-binding protein